MYQYIKLKGDISAMQKIILQEGIKAAVDNKHKIIYLADTKHNWNIVHKRMERLTTSYSYEIMEVKINGLQ